MMIRGYDDPQLARLGDGAAWRVVRCGSSQLRLLTMSYTPLKYGGGMVGCIIALASSFVKMR
jgi:hypothetical protein